MQTFLNLTKLKVRDLNLQDKRFNKLDFRTGSKKGRSNDFKKDDFSQKSGNREKYQQSHTNSHKTETKESYKQAEKSLSYKQYNKNFKRAENSNILGYQPNKPMRLQLALARSGLASRRSCEEFILAGRVEVNGKIVTELGTKVGLTDQIKVDGKILKAEENKRYVLLNKPIGYVCSLYDEKGRAVASDLLKEHFEERLYNVGRLDMFSSGLIIFTNDGNFAAKVSHPSAELEKEYIVETSLPYPRSLPEKFMKGVRVEGVFYKCKFAEGINSRKMRIILIEGKNREIRRVLESFDMRVKSLVRVRIGNLTTKNALGEELEIGNFRELSQSEVDDLLELCLRKKEMPERKRERDFGKTKQSEKIEAGEKILSGGESFGSGGRDFRENRDFENAENIENIKTAESLENNIENAENLASLFIRKKCENVNAVEENTNSTKETTATNDGKYYY